MRVLTTIACAALLVSVGFTSADGTHRPGHLNLHALFETGVLASGGGSVAVGGIPSTGAPFQIDGGGEAKIDEEGGIKVEYTGLSREGDGATTAEEVFATLVCNGTPVADTDPVPVDPDGSATIEQTDFVDSATIEQCRQPIILIRRNGCTIASGCGTDDSANTRWLAISGFVPALAAQ